MPVDISLGNRRARHTAGGGGRSRRAIGSVLLIAAAATAAACTPNVSGGQPAYPSMPTSGRYSTAQYSDAQLTTVANQTYGTAVDSTGATIPLQLDLYLPPGLTVDTPTVVTVHGGGYIGGTRSEMAGAAKSYARRGFVVANIDYRVDPHAIDSPQQFLNAALKAVDDGMEAIRWIRAHADTYHVDVTRIGVVGSSAGGGVSLGLGAGDDPTPGGPLAAFSPKIAAAVSTGATLTPGIEAGLVSIEKTDAPALMFHYDQDSVTQFPADYSRQTCDLLVLAGSRCRWVQQYGRGHTVSLSADGPWWTSEIGPFLWSELRLATAAQP
jgi:acetyl esterase/lipase